jgi:colanic acid biosynthesis glycosyl transferase WcaI
VSEALLPGRALIVGANYWPEESGNAPYTTGVAEDLAAHGVEVTVLCAMPHYPQWRIRAGYRGHLRVCETREGVRLIRSWLWVPTRQSAFQRALFEGSVLLSTLTARGVGRPDVVVGVTPSLSGAVLARILAARFRVPYGLVVQDLVGPGAKQSGMRGGHEVAGTVRAVEKWALSGATGVGIVSRGFRPYLRELGIAEDRVAHVPNWSHIARSHSDPVEVRKRFGLPEGTIVLHAGAMGLKQGLEQVVDAARLDQERGGSLSFVLAGDGSQRDALELRARGVGNVTFLPQQPADRYADLLIASDVLLLSERLGMVNMSLPGKLTSYVSAGKPIVAAVASGGATAAEVERSGAGIVTRAGDPAALVAALVRVSSSPEVATALAEAARSYERSLHKDVCLERARDLVGALGAAGG